MDDELTSKPDFLKEKEELPVSPIKPRILFVFFAFVILALTGLFLLKPKGAIQKPTRTIDTSTPSIRPTDRLQGSDLENFVISKKEFTCDTKEKYKVTLKENTENKDYTNIYLSLSNSDRQILFLTLKEVYREHYHASQFENCHLFIIHRIGYVSYTQKDENWTDELWKYDVHGVGVKLYSQQGLDYRATSNGEIVAIEQSSGTGISIVNTTNGSKKEFTKEEILKSTSSEFKKETENYILELIDWDKSSRVLWGDLRLGAYIHLYWQISYPDGQVNVYVVNLGTNDQTLNTESGLIFYTDQPVFFDVGSRDRWINDHPAYSLHLYSLFGQKDITIDTFSSSVQVQRPIFIMWNSKNQVQYNSPNGVKNYTYTE